MARKRSISSHLQEILAYAEQRCAARGMRLTPVRRHVLSILAEAEAPMGAYDVLYAMERAHGRTAPPTVYRALTFLAQAGLVHRLESLNAFTLCRHGHDHHDAVLFMLCDSCGAVREYDLGSALDVLERTAADAGFHVSHGVIELHGACAACESTAA